VAEAPVAFQVRRVAFLTPQFATEKDVAGGVGSYVLKMAMALGELGVVAEVFVTSTSSGTVYFQGIRVERVARANAIALRGLAWLLRPLAGSQAAVPIHLANARRMATALEKRHLERPFDVVQSSNYHLTGAFVPRAPQRCHLVRISTSRQLFDQAKGVVRARVARAVEAYDARTLRRAEAVYAPSHYLASHFRRTYGIDVEVLRPPAALGTTPATRLPFALPERYLLHFGTLGFRKGSDLIARALQRAWRVEPDLRMVWIGPIPDRLLETYRQSWGENADHVAVLGPVEKSLTYGVLKGAVATVQPSRVDNLPNTVIESLILGVPVIGSDGASIDELVEHGTSGALVPIGDEHALANAMLDAWRGSAPWLGAGFRTPAAIEAMRPAKAVQSFLDLATRVAGGAR
jgi:glycosyltransferase involved in cell wall biosynthesis